MSYKRFCIRYGATSGFCSYKLLPNITSGTVFDKIRQNHIRFKRIKMFGFYFELNEELECYCSECRQQEVLSQKQNVL